jgi:hypothetical protein
MSLSDTNTVNKKVSEQDIIDSLNKAISDYQISSTPQKIEINVTDILQTPTPKVKRTRSKSKPKIEQEIEQELVEKIVEVAEEVIVPVLEVANSTKTKAKTKAKAKTVKKRGKLFSKSKSSKTKSKATRAYTFGISKRVAGVYLDYKRQFLTSSLLMIMFAFVAMSGYVAYAFVASNNNDIVSKVGLHVVLPTDETPKVYIIQSEKSEIFGNPLFKGITVGDNVLTYSKAGKVYIYRGSEDKIVNIVNTTQ